MSYCEYCHNEDVDANYCIRCKEACRDCHEAYLDHKYEKGKEQYYVEKYGEY